jgi:dihydropteroate synthase
MPDKIVHKLNDMPLADGRLLDLSAPRVMGILNVTPDSFSDGGRYATRDAALRRIKQMIDEGADIIDVGGESSRPGANPVSSDEELLRVLPSIQAIKELSDIFISIDTTKADVAEKALKAGAGIVNDISALRSDGKMVEILAASHTPVVLMHMQGTPRDMQKNPHYKDCVGEVHRFFEERIEFCLKNGLSQNQIILDPGIGFGKNLEHNLTLLKNLHKFGDLGCPLLVGASRKSFIGKATGVEREPFRRLGGSLAAALVAIRNGAAIIRVHDVMETVEAVKIWKAIESIN